MSYVMTTELSNRWIKGGSLKRSLGMVSSVFTIPKASGFEAATPSFLKTFLNLLFTLR